jgi:hypothetical protein
MINGILSLSGEYIDNQELEKPVIPVLKTSMKYPI